MVGYPLSAVLLAAGIPAAAALENGLARTPPMGCDAASCVAVCSARRLSSPHRLHPRARTAAAEHFLAGAAGAPGMRTTASSTSRCSTRRPTRWPRTACRPRATSTSTSMAAGGRAATRGKSAATPRATSKPTRTNTRTASRRWPTTSTTRASSTGTTPTPARRPATGTRP